MITPSVVHYSVSCVLLGQLCTTRSVVYIIRSVVCFSVSCVFSISCALLDQLFIKILAGQLCITRSVVHYSVSCELFCQLWITISRLHDDTVSCVSVLGQ